MDRITATYRIETALPLAHTAAAMAGEQSTGTFLKLESEDDPVVQRQAATVERVTELEEVGAPSLPGAVAPKGEPAVWRRGEVVLSWPLDNIGLAETPPATRRSGLASMH